MNVQIDPQKAKIWPKQLKVTLLITEGVSKSDSI